MADVYVARQGGAGGFDKLVALKFLRDQGDDLGSRDMFMQELSTAALLNHPSIVQTFDAGEIDGRMYMAMEFINGETLSRFHRAVMKRTKTFPVDLAVHLVRELANALDYAHSLTTLEGEPLGLVHRDISPSNVLVSVEGSVKLLDFGIARVSTKLHATQTGVIKGKFAYMSPEQAAGEPIDRRADIYALGILLWQLLVGKPAFEADSDAALMYQVLNPNLAAPSSLGFGSPDLDAIVMHALARRANDRYATAGALATDLSAYLAATAPGFDGARAIREHMGDCFAEKKERLARVIRGLPESDLSAHELDLLTGAALNTPSPRVMFGGGPGREDAEISVTPQEPSRPVSPHGGRRHPLVIAAALLALIAPGVIAWRLMDDRAVPGAEPDTSVPAATAAMVPDEEPGAGPAAPSGPAGEASPDGALAAPDRERGTDPASPPGASPASAVAPPARAKTAVRETRGTREVRETRESSGKRPTRTAAATQARVASSSEVVAPAPEVVATRLPAPSAPPTDAAVVPAPVPDPTPAPVAPSPVPAPAPAPAPAPPPVARGPGSLDAIPSIASIGVDGPLPDNEIQSAVQRALGTLRDCYRTAARAAQQTPALRLKLSFSIDEGRAARDLRVSGDSLGMGACVKDAASKLRTRVAPDVGTASVRVVVKFQPVGG